MASTDKPAVTELKLSSSAPPPAAEDCFLVDVFLRFLLFAASLVAIVVIVTSDQTALFFRLNLPQEIKFKHSAAYIYFVVAFSVSGLYSLITALASFSVIQMPDLRLKFLLHFIFWDTLTLGVIASATGAAGGVAYVDLKGNDNLAWLKVCTVYNKYCRHLAGSLAVALFGSFVAVLLIWLSAHGIHSRVPK